MANVGLYCTVDVHAVSDGNGRLCHLVTGSTLREHNFFPAYVQPATGRRDGPETSCRAIYIDAIQACRDHPTQATEDLCALLI